MGPPGAVQPPADVDLRAVVVRAVGAAPGGVQAKVWIAEGRATALRRAGTPVAERELAGRAGTVIEVDTGPYGGLAREIAGYGADAVVLEPVALRDEVVARLRGVVS